MPYCSECGGEIIFRRMNGRRVPIHLSGGCWIEQTPIRDRYRSHASDGYCRLTKCPICGERVFFIRHNGGSVWVDEPLGPPWNKHQCFVTEKAPENGKSLAEEALVKFSSSDDVFLGLVVRVEVHPFGEDTILHVVFGDNDELLLKVRGVAELQGELVFCNAKTYTVKYWKGGASVFHIID